MAIIEMCDAFVWWTQHAPMWQIYSAMTASMLLLILLVLPKRMRLKLWRKQNTAAKHLGYVKTVAVEYEEAPSLAIAVKNAKGEVIPNMSDKTSQGESGTKIDCSAKATSAASVDSLLPA